MKGQRREGVIEHDKPPTPKIAAPQREALEKAKGVDQAVQKETEETKQKI